MKILMIAPGFLPYTFSENLCNGKLALALIQQGHQVTVISRRDEGATYSSSWEAPWDNLQKFTHEITYPAMNFKKNPVDLLRCIGRTRYPFAGVRWASRAIDKGRSLLNEGKYDCIISRSPNDIAHIVGYHLARFSKLPWIANWNDPASPIWPEPYRVEYPLMTKLALGFYTKLLLKHADCNTFPSDSLRLHFERHYPFLSKQYCAVVPHIGLPQTMLPQAATTAKNNGVMRLCHAGNLSAERNPEVLFQALARFEARHPGCIHLDILGYRTACCDQLQQKYNLDALISYPGSFPYLKALDKMAQYDVLVLLEAQMEHGVFFASKTVDYVQLSKPVLAISPVTGFAADHLGKHAILTVDNRSAAAVEDGLEQLYRHFCAGTLSQTFATPELQREFAPETVVGHLEATVKQLHKNQQ